MQNKDQIEEIITNDKKDRSLYAKKYYHENKDRLREYRKNWMREWRKNNPEKQILLSRKTQEKRKKTLGDGYSKFMSDQIKKWRAKNPEKNKAHKKVFVAVRNGSLKKHPCFVCGEPKSEAHHLDYKKPLDVTWVCKKHHIQLDRERRLVE